MRSRAGSGTLRKRMASPAPVKNDDEELLEVHMAELRPQGLLTMVSLARTAQILWAILVVEEAEVEAAGEGVVDVVITMDQGRERQSRRSNKMPRPQHQTSQ